MEEKNENENVENVENVSDASSMFADDNVHNIIISRI
jgi:hypothetical protein